MMYRLLLLLVSTAAVVNCLGDGRPFGTKNVHGKKSPQKFGSPLHQAAAPDAPSTYAQHGYPAMIVPAAVPPSPYSFGYEADGSAREESSDGSGKVTGSYTVVNEDGSKRVVKYIADEQGFRAMIDTDEPGTKSDNPANIELKSSAKEPVYEPAPHQQYKPTVDKYASKTTQQVKYQPPISQHPTKFATPDEKAGPIPPYAFSFNSQLDDGSNSRSESSDGSGKVVGSYSLSTMEGSQRKVDYSADHSGFKASVDTNEFGTRSASPADVKFISSAPQEHVEQKKAPTAHFRPQHQAQHSKKTTFHSSQEHVAQEEYYPPSPYEFNYSADLEDGSIHRTESSDGSGKVVGSYKLSVADGRHRTVEYTADKNGFNANVNTNEFGTKADSPANVMFFSSATDEEPAPYISPASLRQQHKAQGPHVSYQQQQETLPFGGTFQQEEVPSPYSFNYENKMDSGMSAHSESGDASGNVAGSYSLSHADGSQRKVDYTADDSGFKAVVKTNEFGTKSDSPADVMFESSAPKEMPKPQIHTSSTSQKVSSGFHRTEQKMVHEQFPKSPYAFNYEAEGSSRQESSDDNGKVTGSYSITNEDGSTRIVEYVADEMGFRAKVKTNEPGTKSDNPADVSLLSSAKEVTFQQPHKTSGHAFPQRTYSKKSSMISQEHIY